MIHEIHIKNFNIVESLQVSFREGFHVISGETGAGKSILLQSIAFAMGERADSESIRAGSEEAVVTLVLETAVSSGLKKTCEELGLSCPADGTFYLKRTLNASGRSRALINDEPVTLKTLQALGEKWVHLVRQHASRQLLQEEFLFSLLDRFGGHEACLGEYQEAFLIHRQTHREWEALNERIRATRQQEEFLRFQGEELNKAQLRLGEEEELENLKGRLKHRVALAAQTYEMLQLLSESDASVSDQLGKISALAQKSRALDESLSPVHAALHEAMVAVESAGRQLSDYTQSLGEDPSGLDSVEDRLAQIADLKRKYHTDEAGLVRLNEEIQTKLGELENFDQVLEEKDKEKNLQEKKLRELARLLHDKRLASAKRLATKLLASLKELALPQAQIKMEIAAASALEDFREHGCDRMELKVSFNPGEELRPFAEIISGGELSRLLLAFYEIVFPAQEVGTFIFDEVDTGVGGKVAELIGRKLAALSAKTQVLCVTHLPQIACHADWQYVVEKEVKQQRTYSKIRELKKNEREQEIARMLAGVEVTEQALRHARELLKNAAA